MRISTIKTDPGYTQGCVGIRVYLEGAEVTHVFTADEEQRLIVQGDLDATGRLQLTADRQEVKKVTRHGHVRVELPPGFKLWQPEGSAEPRRQILSPQAGIPQRHRQVAPAHDAGDLQV